MEWYRPKRERKTLAKFGIATRRAAMAKAEEVAEEFERADALGRGPLTLHRLLSLYLEEVTPTKAAATQRQDHRAARMFLDFFGASVEPKSIGRKSFNRFVQARRAGAVPGLERPVRNRIIEYNCKFLLAVFNWALAEREDGEILLDRNPWKGFPIPREANPRRPEMTPELHARLVQGAADWRMAGVMELCRETRHRRGSVQNLRWEDVDLAGRLVTWRAEHDKSGLAAVTPLTSRATEVLRRLPRSLGTPWVFPAPDDPSRPVSASTLNMWMRRTKERLGIDVPGLGYHGEKRAGVRDPAFRGLPDAVKEALSGTKAETLRRVYDEVSLPAMQDAVASLERQRTA